MLILIEKDSATRVPKEVADTAEAMGYVDRGFTVHVQAEDGTTALLTAEPAAAEEPAPKKAKKAAA